VHKHPDVGCTLVDRHRERRTPPPDSWPLRTDIGKLRDGGRTRRRRVGFRRDPPPTSRLAEAASLCELSFAQIVQSVNREESNDGTHETKPPELRRR